MLKARKKNRVVRIPDEKAGEYKALGYSIYDMNGNTIYAPEDKDATIATLRKEKARLEERISEYELLFAQAGIDSKSKIETADTGESGPDATEEKAKPRGKAKAE